MGSARNSDGGRKPIHLPSLSFSPSSTATANRNHAGHIRNAFLPNTMRDDDGLRISTTAHSDATWVEKLRDFISRQALKTTSTDVVSAQRTTGVSDSRGSTSPSRASPHPHISISTAAATTTLSSVRSLFHEDDTPSSTSPASAMSFGQRVVALTEELTVVDDRLAVDEGYFNDVAEVEQCILQHLREWRMQAHVEANSIDDNGRKSVSAVRSPRGSGGIYGGTQTGAARLSGSLFVSNLNSNNGNAKASAEGSQRVQTDLENIRQCTTTLEELHNTLSVLEDEHLGLQRRYLVEETATAELDALDEKLSELEREDCEQLSFTTTRAPLKRQRRAQGETATTTTSSLTAAAAHRKTSTKGEEERQTMQAALAVCRELTGELRKRVTTISERLIDELLWMRAESDSHDWSVLHTATSLTKMEPLTVTLVGGGKTAPITTTVGPSSSFLHHNAGSRIAETKKGLHANAAADDMENQSENEDRNSNNEEEGERPSTELLSAGSPSHSSLASSSASFSNSVTDDRGSGSDSHNQRNSFVLRVQVPVFLSTTPPPLTIDDPFTLLSGGGSGRPLRRSLGKESGGSAIGTSGTTQSCTTAATHRVPTHSNTSSRNAVPTAALASAFISPNPATVSVVATPARHALVQLYEVCRDFLAQMLTRLTQLRARRSAEAEQLRSEQQDLDPYDPAADDLSARLTSVLRYLSQLDGYVTAVHTAHQELHARVKLPMDAALQTYECFRTQLLEVFKQRLEQEDEEAAAVAGQISQEAPAREEGGEDGEREGEGVKTNGIERSAKLVTADAQNNPDEDALNNDINSSHSPCEEEQEEQEEEQGQPRPRSSASLSEDRARRSTQSPQVASLLSTTVSKKHDLPRASAEFIGMLDTLFKGQQAALQERQSNVNTNTNTNTAAGDVVPTVEVPAGVTVIRMTSHPHELSTVSGAVKAADNDADVASERKTEPAKRATSTDDMVRTSTHDLHKPPEQQPQAANSRGSQGGTKYDDVEIRNFETASSATTINDLTRGSEGRNSAAAAEKQAHATVVVSSSSNSSDNDNSESVESDSGSDDDDDNDDNLQQQHAMSRAHPRCSERTRYGLCSEDGFSGGLRAFFAAVARRVMDFGDSGEDESVYEDEEEVMTERQRKRVRRE